jgi:FtsH-binding integral membrane protein
MTQLLIPYVVMLHTIGALIGVGVTTFAEIFYMEAASDGRIDHHERKYLRRMFRALTFGLGRVLVTGVGLIVLEYLVPDAAQDVLVAPFWALETFTVLIIFFGLRISQKKAPWWLASAAILAAWWMILLIDLGYLNAYGYAMILMLYVLVTFVLAGALGYLRVLVGTRLKKKSAADAAD